MMAIINPFTTSTLSTEKPVTNVSRRAFLRSAAATTALAATTTSFGQTLAAAEHPWAQRSSVEKIEALENAPFVTKVTTANEVDNFFESEEVKNSKGVLVMMTASWCQPCKEFKLNLANEIINKGNISKTEFAGMKILFIDASNDKPSLEGSKVSGVAQYIRQKDLLPRIAVLNPDGSIGKKDNGNNSYTIFTTTGNNYSSIKSFAKEIRAQNED